MRTSLGRPRNRAWPSTACALSPAAWRGPHGRVSPRPVCRLSRRIVCCDGVRVKAARHGGCSGAARLEARRPPCRRLCGLCLAARLCDRHRPRSPSAAHPPRGLVPVHSSRRPPPQPRARRRATGASLRSPASLIEQSTGFALSLHWVRLGGLTVSGAPTTLCTAQSVLIQAGDVASALWTLVLAVHTSIILGLRRKPSTAALVATIAFIWTLVAFLAAIGPVVIARAQIAPFYDQTGACVTAFRRL